MSSPNCEHAIEDALKHGNALLKFISPNNVGLTGSHECGFYLPKAAWELFTPYAPVKGANAKYEIRITWQDGRVTDSVVTWYGVGTRSEYRLTCFGKDFPYLNEGVVGDLLVLIGVPRDDGPPNEFFAYVLDLDEDIEDLQATLGVNAFGKWGVFKDGTAQQAENESECVERRIREFSGSFHAFPSNQVFSEATREILAACGGRRFAKLSVDELLVKSYATEYELFRSVERIVCQNDVSGRLFRDIDDFLKVAGSIMNRRKSRAGRSLENHVEAILKSEQIPHEMRPDLGADGTPDCIIPSASAYFDTSFPTDRLVVVGLKTTCKDRWRQVTQEGLRVKRKHLVTLQKGVTKTQLAQMESAHVTLVVPKSFHDFYPQNSTVQPVSLKNFIEEVRRLNRCD